MKSKRTASESILDECLGAGMNRIKKPAIKYLPQSPPKSIYLQQCPLLRNPALLCSPLLSPMMSLVVIERIHGIYDAVEDPGQIGLRQKRIIKGI